MRLPSRPVVASVRVAIAISADVGETASRSVRGGVSPRALGAPGDTMKICADSPSNAAE